MKPKPKKRRRKSPVQTTVTLAKLLKSKRDIIVKVRDELRDLADEIGALADASDEGLLSLEAAIDEFSRLA